MGHLIFLITNVSYSLWGTKYLFLMGASSKVHTYFKIITKNSINFFIIGKRDPDTHILLNLKKKLY